MISLILSRPYDTYGCWYNNAYLVSSDHEWLNHTVSCNKFWINRVIFPPSLIIPLSLGTSLGFWEISWASGMDLQITPEFWWSTAILFITNPSLWTYGVDGPENPSLCVDREGLAWQSVRFNLSL